MTSSRNAPHRCQPELRGILCGLRRCLKNARLERSNGNPFQFHYAEALVYAHPEEWWPLEGVDFDILKKESWPDDYQQLFEDLRGPISRIPSMLELLGKRKHTHKIFRPLLRALAKTKQDEILAGSPPDADKLSSSFIPGIDCYFGDADPASEAEKKNVKQYFEVVEKYPKYYPQKESGLVFLVPLTGQLIGIPLILAQVIIMLNITGDDWQDQVSYRILPALDEFSRAGSALLLDRHEFLLTGYNPSTDVSDLFIHPALTRPGPRKQLAFKDVSGSHNNLNDFRIGYDGYSTLRPGWEFLTVFRRNIQFFNELIPRGKATRNSASVPSSALLSADPFQLAWTYSLTADDCADYRQPPTPPDRRDFRDSLHRWLKTLYAEGGDDGRIGSKYLLYREHLVWLAITVSKALQPKWEGPSDHIEDSFSWPCAIIFASDKDARFSWPVIPGVRFLLPWLKLLSELAKEIKQGTEEISVSALLFETGTTREVANAPPLWNHWVKYLDQSDEDRCGVLVEMTNVSEAGHFRRSIHRQLVAQHKHIGGTVHLFRDVLNCDITRVTGLPAEILAAHRSETPDIYLDLETPDDSTLLIGFCWAPPGSNSTIAEQQDNGDMPSGRSSKTPE